MNIRSTLRLSLCLTWLALGLAGIPACGDDDNSPGDGGVAGNGGTTGGSGGTSGGSGGATGGSGGSGTGTTGSNGGGTAGTSGTTGTTGTSGAGGSSGTGSGGSSSDAGVQLSDAQIASVMMTANTGEIQAAQVALKRASDRAVHDFANRMVTDHTKANDMLMTTLQSLSLAPATNSISQELMMQAMQEIQDLNKVTGSNFDRKYMNAQVKDHMMVLDLIDMTLMPQVDNALLRNQLMAMRATVKAHLTEAKQIAGDL